MGVRSRSTAGGAQNGLAVSTTVVSLTVPRAGMVAEMYVRTASVVFKRNTVDPTATEGTQANVGDIIVLNSRAECDNFRVIRQGSVDAALDIEYFTDISA